MKTIKVSNFRDIPTYFTGCVEYPDGDMRWYKEGKLHREDGPAIKYFNGHKEWWIEGNLHRLDGSAIEYTDGTKEWWIKYVEYYEDTLQYCINTYIFLDVENYDSGTYWLKFLCENGIKKYPFIPGMNVDISNIIK